jgi:hypothetical protein
LGGGKKVKGPGLQIDERNVTITRKICTRLYLLTVAALWLDVCWRQFFAGQPLGEFIDLAVLMTVNVVLFIGAILFYGGVTMPRIRISAIAVFYLVCVATGAAFTVYKYRHSSIGEIVSNILLIAAISGLFVLLYAVLAYLGAKKTDREAGE